MEVFSSCFQVFFKFSQAEFFFLSFGGFQERGPVRRHGNHKAWRSSSATQNISESLCRAGKSEPRLQTTAQNNESRSSEWENPHDGNRPRKNLPSKKNTLTKELLTPKRVAVPLNPAGSRARRKDRDGRTGPHRTIS